MEMMFIFIFILDGGEETGNAVTEMQDHHLIPVMMMYDCMTRNVQSVCLDSKHIGRYLIPL